MSANDCFNMVTDTLPECDWLYWMSDCVWTVVSVFDWTSTIKTKTGLQDITEESQQVKCIFTNILAFYSVKN